MKIRDKIALNFAVLSACLLLVVFIVVYFFSNLYTQREFFSRLSERASIAAQAFLEQDELSSTIYNQILQKHLRTLPQEKESFFRLTNTGLVREKGDDLSIPQSFFEEVLQTGSASLKQGTDYFYGIYYEDNQGHFVIVTSAQNPYGQGKMNNLRNILLIAFLLSLVAIFFMGQHNARQALSPISDITARVNRIRAANLHLRLDTGTNKDELSALAITFNQMLDRLQTSFELQNNFISNASHEFKNPLTAILGETEIAQMKRRSGEEYEQSLAIIEKEAQRLNLLIDGLLKLAQTDFDAKGLIIEPVRMDELLLETREEMSRVNPKNQVQLNFNRLPEQPQALLVQGNKSLLKVALTNIIENANKFSSNQPVDVYLEATENTVIVSVTDRGIGIPPGELENIMEPFFRASNVRGIYGFGVGLPLAQRIIKLHDGQLHISSQPGAGTTMKISMPNSSQNISVAR